MMGDLAEYSAAIEAELRDILNAPEEAVAPLYQMMQYHMGWLDRHFQPEDAPRGKLLRPLMCLLACEAVGGDWRRAVAAACAIELIHNFSLLHDDIEDKSETRRHRATAWSLWGIAQGINTGDTMWAISRLATLRLSRCGYPAEAILRVSRVLDGACLELCTGQYLDLRFETLASISVAEYERMVMGKTAALFSASLAVGVILGGAEQSLVDTYRSFGRELGLTFQVSDDILGIWGDPQVTGKPAVSDILAKKKTLPLLYALRWEADQGCGDLRRIYSRTTVSPRDLPGALAVLERAGALEYARAHAREHHRRTLACLEATGITNPAQDALRDLALSILNRSF